MKFLCGAAREIITPAIGMLLYGYRPDVKSDSVHDDLTLSAIAFGGENRTAVLISADICSIQNELTSQLRKAVAAECHISERDVIVAATHTHCAPNLTGMQGWGEIDRPYFNEVFLPAAIKAAKRATKSMCEAEVGTAAGAVKSA